MATQSDLEQPASDKQPAVDEQAAPDRQAATGKQAAESQRPLPLTGLRVLSVGTHEDARYMLAPALLDPDPIIIFEYTSMLWALIYGLVLWGDRPDAVTITGAALVIGAGLYMLRADRRAAARTLAQTT